MTFQAWVEELIARRFKTATALAHAIGMKLSPFTRGVAAGTLNLVNLLKLAKAAEAHPSMVLRLARKGKEADLLEELYGPGLETLTASQRELVALYGRITDAEDKETVRVLVRRLATLSSAGAPPATASESPSPLRAATARAKRTARRDRPGVAGKGK